MLPPLPFGFSKRQGGFQWYSRAMKTLTAVLACLAISCLVAGCAMFQNPNELASGVNQAEQEVQETRLIGDRITEELRILREELENLDTNDPDADRSAERLAAFIAEKTEESAKWLQRLNDANAAALKARDDLSSAQNKWDVAEALVAFGAGLFPPLAVATPLIRAGRRNFEGVVAAVAAGGGPKNSEAARAAMAAVPGLKDRVTQARVRIGDKRMEAVPSKNNGEVS
jgi:chromosome segregation ATPase